MRLYLYDPQGTQYYPKPEKDPNWMQSLVQITIECSGEKELWEAGADLGTYLLLGNHVDH